MTRRKQPWGQQRGWIVPADGSPPQELPQHMFGLWTGTMPEREPAQPLMYLALKDHYHRHVLNPEGVFVYVPEGRDAQSPARVHQERNPAPVEGTVVGALDLLRGFIAPSLAVARPRFWLGDGKSVRAARAPPRPTPRKPSRHPVRWLLSHCRHNLGL
jgi:hypothetical protein